MKSLKPTVLRLSRSEALGVLVGAIAVVAVTWIRVVLVPITGSDMALI